MTRLKRMAPIGFALAALFCLLPSGVLADGSVIRVSPSKVGFGSVDAGTKNDFAFSVTNLADAPVVVDMKLEDQGNPGHTYLTLTPNPLELPPKGQRNVILSLQLPPEAHAGKYSAGILFLAESVATEGLGAALVAGVEAEAKFRIEGYRSEVFAFDAETGIAPVRLLVNLSNFMEDKDVTGHAEITIQNADSGQIVETLRGDAKEFKRSGGIHYWEFVRDSAAYPPGDYVAKATVYVKGPPVKVIQTQEYFKLGFREGELVDPGKGLTVLASRVQAGEPIRWYVTLANKGTLPLNFRIQTTAQDDQGDRLLVKQEEGAIPEGETSRFDFAAPTRSQGVPTSLEALRFVLSGSKEVTMETHIAFANSDELNRFGKVTIAAPLQVRIVVFSVMVLFLVGILAIGIAGRRRFCRRKTA